MLPMATFDVSFELHLEGSSVITSLWGDTSRERGMVTWLVPNLNTIVPTAVKPLTCHDRRFGQIASLVVSLRLWDDLRRRICAECVAAVCIADSNNKNNESDPNS